MKEERWREASMMHKSNLTRLIGFLLFLMARSQIRDAFLAWLLYRANAQRDAQSADWSRLQGEHAFLKSHLTMLEEQLLDMEAKSILHPRSQLGTFRRSLSRSLSIGLRSPDPELSISPSAG